MKLFLSIALILSSVGVLAQHSELITQLKALREQIGEVRGQKASFSQQVQYREDIPYRIEIITEETDKKGNSVERRAVFNLGLLDKNMVRRENSKDLMWISARSGGMRVIKMYENGEVGDYVDELKLYSNGVDNARAIEEILQTAIPLASAAWEQSISFPSDLPSLEEWVVDLVSNVNAGETTFNQSVKLDEAHPGRARLIIEKHGEKGLESSKRFTWNFGDLHEPSIQMKVRRKIVTVEAGIRQNQDFVSVEKDGQMSGFSNSIIFYTEDVDQAQLLIQIMRKTIPLAREAWANTLPAPSSRQEGLQLLGEQVQDFSVNQKEYKQLLTESAPATYTRSLTGPKVTSEMKFIFDFSDLNEQGVSIQAENQWLAVEVPVKKAQSLVEVWEDGEQRNYADQVAFFVADLPSAKRLHHLLRYVINASDEKVAPQDFEWLTTTFNNFDKEKLGIGQQIEMQEGERCKVLLTTVEQGRNNVEEHRIEFNLYDLEPGKIALEIRGKVITVVLPTQFREDIIKDYENSDDINYINKVSLKVPNIEIAKIVMATLQQTIQACKQDH